MFKLYKFLNPDLDSDGNILVLMKLKKLMKKRKIDNHNYLKIINKIDFVIQNKNTPFSFELRNHIMHEINSFFFELEFYLEKEKMV